MKEDECLTPSTEDLILIDVMTLIHPKLPQYVREHYAHQIAWWTSKQQALNPVANTAKERKKTPPGNMSICLSVC